MGQSVRTTHEDGDLDLVITNALVIDYTAVSYTHLAEQYFRENKAVCQRIWGRERTEQIEREMDCYHFKTVAEWLEQWEKEGECHVSGTVCR